MLTELSVLSEPGAAKPLEYGSFETKPKEKPKVLVQGEAAPLASRWPLAANPLEAALSPEARAQRQLLETELAALRKSKGGLGPGEYHKRLESILLKLSTLYTSAQGR